MFLEFRVQEGIFSRFRRKIHRRIRTGLVCTIAPIIMASSISCSKDKIINLQSVESLDTEMVEPLSTSQKSLDRGKIAYVSNRDGRQNPEVYTMTADGSDQRNISNNPGHDYSPSWSPNGREIDFVSERDGNPEVYTMAADGSDQRNISNNPAWDFAPSRSPDGSKIAHASNKDGNWELYEIDTNSLNERRLTNNLGHDGDPSWSPDGTKMVFASHLGTKKDDICVISVDSPNQTRFDYTRLTYDPAISYPTIRDSYPSWSPDGMEIAFASDRDGGDYDIYVMSADGSNLRRLTDDPADDQDPSWGPN